MKYTFTRTWYNANEELPKESGRYLVIIEEINDLGTSHYVWNCSYSADEKLWSDQGKSVQVIFWTVLPHVTFVRDEKIRRQIISDYQREENKTRANSLANNIPPVKPIEKYNGNIIIK